MCLCFERKPMKLSFLYCVSCCDIFRPLFPENRWRRQRAVRLFWRVATTTHKLKPRCLTVAFSFPLVTYLCSIYQALVTSGAIFFLRSHSIFTASFATTAANRSKRKRVNKSRSRPSLPLPRQLFAVSSFPSKIRLVVTRTAIIPLQWAPPSASGHKVALRLKKESLLRNFPVSNRTKKGCCWVSIARRCTNACLY